MNIYIPYTNIKDLIDKFQKIPLNSQINTDKNTNFVILHDDAFCGTYGGILAKELINDFEKRNLSFIYDEITSKLCLVWWNGLCNITGDMSLKKNGYALVTKQMFSKIRKENKFKKIKSSYYE